MGAAARCARASHEISMAGGGEEEPLQPLDERVHVLQVLACSHLIEMSTLHFPEMSTAL